MKKNIILKLYFLFLVLFEILHVHIGDAPSSAYRIIYISIFITFCFSKKELIPMFVVGNLIIERFSTIYGEFLPNTLWFHIIILLLYTVKYKTHLNNNIYIYTQDKRAFNLFILYIVIHSFAFTIIGAHLTTISYAIFSCIFLLCLYRMNEKERYTILQVLIYSTLIACLFGLYNFNNIVVEYAINSGLDHVNRLAWKDSNYLSFWIGLMIILTLHLKHFSNSAKEKYSYNLIITIFLLLITMLISRGTIISLVLTMSYLYRKKIFSLKIVSIIIGVIVFLYIFYILGLLDGIILRFMSEDAMSGSGRNEIWETAINSFVHQDISTIIFGIGDGLAPQLVSINFIKFSTHNNYIEYLLNFGVIGLVVFLYFLLTLLFSSKTKERKAFVIFIMINCMSIVPFMHVSLLWAMIPIIMVWDNLTKDEKLNKIKL